MQIIAFCKRNAIALYRIDGNARFTAKTWKVMRLIAVLLTVFCLQVSAKTWSQRITFSGDNVSLEKVFSEIHRQTGYFVIYDAALLRQGKPVTIKSRDVPLANFVKQVLADQPFTYFIKRTTIVIRQREPVVITEFSIADSLLAPPPIDVRGRVVDEKGEPVSGASVRIQHSSKGTATNERGEFMLAAVDEDAVLEISGVTIQPFTVRIGGRAALGDLHATTRITEADAIVVVGYGTQKRRDLTGTVASVPQERLQLVPNVNIAQAIQGAIPGVMVQTTSAAAAPDQTFMVRGRNSIRASNAPLVIVDGIPYGGNISDINPGDVKSIEVLKDASAAAIYGSRGSNGVILVTTHQGNKGAPAVNYDLKYAIMDYTNLPDVMDGEEFYRFKMARKSNVMTTSEQAIYESGSWVDWYDLATRQGRSQQHELSVSGGGERVSYYLSGGLLDVLGVVKNDNYRRGTGRVNLEVKVTPWLSLGTRTQLTYGKRDGIGPDFNWVYYSNPLTTAYDADGQMVQIPWPGNEDIGTPLESFLWDNRDRSQQVMSNNYLNIDFPFIKGLSYKLNTGIRNTVSQAQTYRGRNSITGLKANGNMETSVAFGKNIVVENVLQYSREIGVHNLSGTAVYSYEENENTGNSVSARDFPHDFLAIYSVAQAGFSQPSYSYGNSHLISQMLRLNYSYDGRYLLTLTGRRDGFSGFGANTKWGVFPSAAVGWNLAREEFAPFGNLFSELKLRASWGLNGNQAVDSYSTISRLSARDGVDGGTTQSGYIPSVLGQVDLGWETSATVNVGLDFGIWQGRLSGGLNLFETNTSDLLLARSISPVHGLSSITQNIGKTQNKGIELALQYRNAPFRQFSWSAFGNISYIKNKIVDLYGNGLNDMVNGWFIGSPILVNYNYVVEGIWQEKEAAEAAAWGSQPGFVKIKDLNKDGKLDANDRQIIGQQDPKFLWGLGNTFSYARFSLTVFVHGVHGVTRKSDVMTDRETWGAEVRRNTINKDWWTPENPNAKFVMNHLDAEVMAGIISTWYENASFVRVKDISLTYDVNNTLLSKVKLNRLRLYLTGRNLFTLTRWTGLDPELSNQLAAPLKKEFVFGLNIGL